MQTKSTGRRNLDKHPSSKSVRLKVVRCTFLHISPYFTIFHLYDLRSSRHFLRFGRHLKKHHRITLLDPQLRMWSPRRLSFRSTVFLAFNSVRSIRPFNDLFTQNPQVRTSVNPPHFDVKGCLTLKHHPRRTFPDAPDLSASAADYLKSVNSHRKLSLAKLVRVFLNIYI